MQTLEAREIESKLEVLDIVNQLIAFSFVVLRDIERSFIHRVSWLAKGAVLLVTEEGPNNIFDDFFYQSNISIRNSRVP